MEKEILVGEKKFKVRELLAIELDDVNWDDRKEAVKKEVLISTGMDEETYNKLTVKERLAIVQTINEVNGFEAFQQPTIK